MSVTLKEFLTGMENNRFTYLDTDNDTFPEIYRSKFYSKEKLFADIYRNINDGGSKLFDTKLESFALIPSRINTNICNNQIAVNPALGFIYINDNNTTIPVGAVIKITLEVSSLISDDYGDLDIDECYNEEDD